MLVVQMLLLERLKKLYRTQYHSRLPNEGEEQVLYRCGTVPDSHGIPASIVNVYGSLAANRYARYGIYYCIWKLRIAS
jgi:hypothetical protein